MDADAVSGDEVAFRLWAYDDHHHHHHHPLSLLFFLLLLLLLQCRGCPKKVGRSWLRFTGGTSGIHTQIDIAAARGPACSAWPEENGLLPTTTTTRTRTIVSTIGKIFPVRRRNRRSNGRSVAVIQIGGIAILHLKRIQSEAAKGTNRESEGACSPRVANSGERSKLKAVQRVTSRGVVRIGSPSGGSKGIRKRPGDLAEEL